MTLKVTFFSIIQALRVWDEYVKRNGTLEYKQARDVVYESPLLSRLPFKPINILAEPWLKPGLCCKWNIAINWVSASTTKRRNKKASGRQLP